MSVSHSTLFRLWYLTGMMFVAGSLAADHCDGETFTFYWSDATECYEFDTGKIFGVIQPYSWYHGVAGLMHRQNRVDVVRPRNALLNAEYYLRPGSGPLMKPRELSSGKKITHRLVDGKVILQFPAEPDYAFPMQLAYRPHDDMIDMQMTILPSKDVADFEIFFASYVAEALSQTWVPLTGSDGSVQWTKLDNRGVRGRMFGIVRDREERRRLDDGRWGKTLSDPAHCELEDRFFHRPILVARDPDSGVALVFLCDPRQTTFLAGQYHGWDTAHDWCYSADLVPRRPLVTSTRLIYRPFANLDAMFRKIDREWASFVTERIGDAEE